MVAQEPVSRGQVLVRVPTKLLMTSQTAEQSEACGALIRDARLSEWQVRRCRRWLSSMMPDTLWVEWPALIVTMV